MPNAPFWQVIPFHFWSVALFCFGSIVGSFLNVCIHRMPRGESVVSPPSHCPHCNYSIPWYLNIPLATWLMLGGKCRNCGAPISVRYLLVELLTGALFLSCWLVFGAQSPALALVYCLLLAGFIAATFIDIEHFIIPDEITLGGIVAGFVCSFFVHALHAAPTTATSLERCFAGVIVGAGVIYGIVRLGKMLFGRQKFELVPDSTVFFTETTMMLPDREIPYEEIFYRKSDTIVLQAKTVEMVDRCYALVPVRLSPALLRVGDDTFKPDDVQHLEVVTNELVVPREAMGLGDVKFMAAIGAFLGWQAVVFTLMLSSIVGATYGLSMIALKKQEWSGRLYYGPFIALAATLWIFGGGRIMHWWLGP
ncbi:MAG TPA: prepilin peptidase [Candidatus Angelobacter sp.]|nr:prepilin peptidase [Candidatus Angelobacter sp.]